MKYETTVLMLLILMVSVSATAQHSSATPYYREGQPVAVPPRPEVAAAPSIEPGRLRAALQAARNPRFVLMWNKALSDNVVTEYEAVSRTVAAAELSSPPPTAVVVQESRTGTKAVREAGERSALAQDDDWKVRGDFEGWLIDAGMDLVDRLAALRQAGLKIDGDQPNLQKVEMDALRSHADYMLEVLSTHAQGPAGARFRIRVTNLRSGQTIASLSSTGVKPSVTRTHFVATESGYRKVSDMSEATIDDVGVQLARELAERLIEVNLVTRSAR